jgi:iron complex outermembrane receptor protein
MECANKILDEVVISAGRYEQKLSDVTVSMEIIKPSLVENKSTVSLDQIVNQVPGINVSDGQASIRAGSGFSYGAGSRVLMLVDEMPMISADAADIKWNYLPLENISQIEVIKGASSALFGSSALNGVINMRTNYAKDKPITSIQTYYGMYDTPRRAGLHWWKGKNSPSYKGTYFSHLQKLGKLDLVIGGNFYQDDGFRYLASEMRGRATVNVRYNFAKIPGLSVGINGNLMQVQGGLFFLWHNDSLAYTPRDSSIQAYNNTRYNIDPFIVYHHEKFGKHSLRTRYFRTVNVNDKNQSSTADLIYGEYQGQKHFKKDFTLTLGLVHLQQQVFSDSLYGRHTGTNWAGYLQADKKWKKLTVSFGLRCESFKVDTAKTKGEFRIGNKTLLTAPFEPVMRLGLNYQLLKYTWLRASYGQGYRFPSVAEKYIQTNVNGLNIWPNASLQPERGQSAELGVKQGFGIGGFKGFLDVAGFWMEYNNMMDFIFRYFYKDPNSLSLNTLLDSSGFQSVNILKTQITGVDVTVNGNGNIGPVNISAMIGYTYAMPVNLSDSALLDTTGTMRNTRLLKYRNPELFKGDVQIEYKGFAIGWSARFTSYMRNIDKRFEEPVIYEWVSPAFPIYNSAALYVLPGLRNYRKNQRGTGDWMHDFRISYQVSEHFKLAFICNNVFNYEFMSRPGYIEAPRTFIFQANLKF